MKNLKFLREESGISQQKLADVIGSIQQSIQKYEVGNHEPDIQTMTMLADYFNTSIDFLVGRTDIRNKIEPVEKYELNVEEAGIVDRFRNLSPEFRECVSVMFEALTKAIDSTK